MCNNEPLLTDGTSLIGNTVRFICENDSNRQRCLIDTTYLRLVDQRQAIIIPNIILDKYRKVAKDGRKSLRDTIKRYYDNALNGQKTSVGVNNCTIDVLFGNDGKKKTVGRRGLTPRKAATIEYLIQLIGSAKYVCSEENRKERERQDVPKFHYFVNGASIEGINVPIKIIVRELILPNGIERRYYTHDFVENKGSAHPGLRNDADSVVTGIGKIMEAPSINIR